MSRAPPGTTDSETLHRRGVMALQQRRFAEAERLIREALAIRPNYAEALNNRGTALCALGQLELALMSYAKALALRPDYTDALNNRAAALYQLDRFGEALASCDEALALRPEFAEALCNRGNVLWHLGRLGEALASWERALVVKPDYVEALCNRGMALWGLQRAEEALASWDEVLALRPDHIEVLNNRGMALHRLGRLSEALASYDKALANAPAHVEAWNNRGYLLHSLGRVDEALVAYDRALGLRPGFVEALNNRGVALWHLRRREEALASYETALAIRPDNVEVLTNRGIVLGELGRLEEALANYEKALTIRPDYPDAHWNEGLTRLSAGDFGRGWEKYEWRWRRNRLRDQKRDFAAPLWLGKENVSGKIVLLHAEQGLGDTLQFCRYASAVAARGAGVVLEVPTPLKSLLRALPAIEQIVSWGERPPRFDFHCPLMSLPLAFGTRLDTIPAHTPYLWANPFRVDAWRERLANFNGVKTGLVWAGNSWEHDPAANRVDRRRSMRLRQMAELTAIGEIAWVSLQKGEPASQAQNPPAGMALVDWTDELNDFADTAALVEALDLVITVDTSVAHLAGALGKPVWVLHRHDRCWRWLRDREDSPWYPTMRLFTQPSPGDWASVIARVAAELRRFVARVRP